MLGCEQERLNEQALLTLGDQKATEASARSRSSGRA